jgi:hypothetical protein
MLAKKLKQTVPKFLRDQLMLTMHYKHKYEAEDLRQMFHLSLRTVRSIISKKFLISVGRE